MKKVSTVIVCDRCGMECHPGSWWRVIVRHNDSIDIHKADLCQKCGDGIIVASSPPASRHSKNELVWGRREGEECAICGGRVCGYVWWTKNPDHYDDAKPIHPGDCTAKWMGA